MSTTLGFKDTIDTPQWRPCAPVQVATVAGSTLCNDMRNDVSQDPFIYSLNNTLLSRYSPTNDGWQPIGTAITAANGAGSALVFHAGQGPKGTLTTGSSTTKVVLSTALPTAVGIDQLANNGSGLRGYKIRIVGNANGSSSGKTEEKFIIGNTAGTAPTIVLDSALSFSPASGDAYEILSGKVYCYGGGVTSGTFKSWEVATETTSAALTSPGVGAAAFAVMIAMSEMHVPATSSPGLGFFGLLTATASATTSITGTVAGADSALIADQYRNFQVRIVTDTGTPAASGQRRKITTHTGGASPVYTVATWTTTPSASAIFVIELDNDKILLAHDGSTNTYCYNIAAATWDSTTYAVQPAVRGNGSCFGMAFGIALGTDLTNDPSRHSHIFTFRGTNTTTLDLFDISLTTTGTWSAAIAYKGIGALPTSGWMSTFDPVTNGGRYMYLNSGSIQTQQYNYRFDMKNRHLEPWAYLRYPGSTSLQANTMAHAIFQDGATKLAFIYVLQHTSQNMFSIAAQR